MGNASNHKRGKVSISLYPFLLILGLESSKAYHFSKTEIISFKEKNVIKPAHYNRRKITVTLKEEVKAFAGLVF